MTATGLARPGMLDNIFPPLVGGERRIGVFACYADRSTVTEGGAAIFTVAGVIAPAASWDRDFAPAWKAILDREGIECFHMTDYESGKKHPYKSWTKERRISFLAELIEVIKGTETIAGAVALDMRAYNKLTNEQREWTGHPYRFCGALLLTIFSNWLWRWNTPDPVAYVFEAGDNGSGELKRAVDSLPRLRQRELHVQSFVYGAKDEFIALQAADVLAYEAAKAAVRDIGADSRVHRKSLLAILEGVPEKGYLFDERTLNSWVETRRDPFGYPA